MKAEGKKSMTIRLVQFLAIILIAVYLVPVGTHLFELPNKIGLDAPSYMAAQRLYDGWSRFGFVLVAAIVATAALAALSRPQPLPRFFAAAGLVLLLAAAAGFFLFVRPMNLSTVNWTVIPENLDAARTQWEYGHSANAVLAFLALVATVISALAWKPPADR
jgi:hypothetical protein